MIPIAKFGQDHWSTLGYLETRIVDFKGIVVKQHMRCINARHPHRAHEGGDASPYPTRLRGGETISNHDDWDCLDDFESAGLIEVEGTGLYPVFRLTEYGLSVTAALRAHKARGGSFKDFIYDGKTNER